MTTLLTIYNATKETVAIEPTATFTFYRNLNHNGSNTRLTLFIDNKEVRSFYWHSERSVYLYKHSLDKSPLREFSDVANGYRGHVLAGTLIEWIELFDTTVARKSIIDELLADLP